MPDAGKPMDGWELVHLMTAPGVAIKLDAGTTTLSSTVILDITASVGSGFVWNVKLVVSAHWPAAGVNIYFPFALLSTTAGLQLPLIPLVDAAGKTGTVEPTQTD